MPKAKANSVVPATVLKSPQVGEPTPAKTINRRDSFRDSSPDSSPDIFLVHPNDRRKVRWDLWLAFLIIYSTITVPFRIGFNAEATGIWLAIDIMVDIFFFLDMVVSFRTSFCNTAGDYTWDPKIIAKNYLRGWFAIDFVSTFPIDQVAGAVIGGGETSTLRAIKLIRVLRLVRLIKLVKLLNITELIEANEDIVPINTGVFSIFSMLAKVVFLAHLVACFWYMAGQASDGEGWIHSYFGDTDSKPQNWTDPAADFCAASACDSRPFPANHTCVPTESTLTYTHRYTTALYWSITTMATVGYGDLNTSSDTERAFSILVMLIGASIFGYTCGMISVVAASLDARGAVLSSKMEDFKDYMLEVGMQSELQKRLRRHWSYYYRMKSVFDEAEIIRQMPGSVQADMVQQQHGAINELRVKLPEFLGANRDTDFLAQIVPLLKPLFGMTDEVLFTEGCVGWHMYWVLEGRVSLKVVSTHEVTRGRTAHVASVVRGGCLGENFVLEADSDADESGEHGDESGGEGEGEGESESGGAEGAGGLSPCTARCAKYTELTSVSRPGLTPIFDEYPEFEHQLRDSCRALTARCRAARLSPLVPRSPPHSPCSSRAPVPVPPAKAGAPVGRGQVAALPLPPLAQVPEPPPTIDIVSISPPPSPSEPPSPSSEPPSPGASVSGGDDDDDGDGDDDDDGLNPSADQLWTRHRLIHPELPRKVYWDLVIGALIIYSVIVVPLRLSFGVEATGAGAALDVVMDLMFGADMLLAFATAFFNERCELVFDGPAIRRHYLRGWFTVDFLSTFPFDRVAGLFLFIADDNATSGSANNPCDAGGGGGLRSIKLLRVLRLARLAKLVKLLKNGPLYEKFEDATAGMHSSLFSVPALFVILLFFGHLNACVWYWAAFEEFDAGAACGDSVAADAGQAKLRRLLGNGNAPRSLLLAGGPTAAAAAAAAAATAATAARGDSSYGNSGMHSISGSSSSSSSDYSGYVGLGGGRHLSAGAVPVPVPVPVMSALTMKAAKRESSWLCNYAFGGPCACDSGTGFGAEGTSGGGTGTKGDVAMAQRYMLSFYWAMTTMTTVGYGDISPHSMSEKEKVVAIISMLLGTAVFAFVIGEVLMVVLNFDPSATLEKEAKATLKSYITHEKNLGSSLKHVVRRNLAYQVKVHSIFNTGAIFETMPEFLFHKLQQANHSDTLERHFLFADWDARLAGSFSLLAPLLRPVAILRGERVCRAGSRVLTMYWVEKGRCEVLRERPGGDQGPGQGEGIAGKEDLQQCHLPELPAVGSFSVSSSSRRDSSGCRRQSRLDLLAVAAAESAALIAAEQGQCQTTAGVAAGAAAVGAAADLLKAAAGTGVGTLAFGPGDHFGQECLSVPVRTRCCVTRTVLVTSSGAQLLGLARADLAGRLAETCPLLVAQIKATFAAPGQQTSGTGAGGPWVQVLED